MNKEKSEMKENPWAELDDAFIDRFERIGTERVKELKEAKVFAIEDKAIKDQTFKVSQMSDEEFKEYKEALIDIRETIIKELKASEPPKEDE